MAIPRYNFKFSGISSTIKSVIQGNTEQKLNEDYNFFEGAMNATAKLKEAITSFKTAVTEYNGFFKKHGVNAETDAPVSDIPAGVDIVNHEAFPEDVAAELAPRAKIGIAPSEAPLPLTDGQMAKLRSAREVEVIEGTNKNDTLDAAGRDPGREIYYDGKGGIDLLTMTDGIKEKILPTKGGKVVIVDHKADEDMLITPATSGEGHRPVSINRANQNGETGVMIDLDGDGLHDFEAYFYGRGQEQKAREKIDFLQRQAEINDREKNVSIEDDDREIQEKPNPEADFFSALMNSEKPSPEITFFNLLQSEEDRPHGPRYVRCVSSDTETSDNLPINNPIDDLFMAA